MKDPQKTKVYKDPVSKKLPRDGYHAEVPTKGTNHKDVQSESKRKTAYTPDKLHQDPAPIPVLGLVLGAEGASLGTMPTLGSGI